MLKTHLLGMQRLARKGPHLPLQRCMTRQMPGASTIDYITQHSMSYVGQMDTNLVGTARLKTQTAQANGSPVSKHLIVRPCRTPVTRYHSHFLPLLWVAPNGGINGALQCRQTSTHQGKIATLELACFQLRRQTLM